MDHVVASELVWALSRAGHPTLRFNFRGVGASPGTRGDGRSQQEDARAALSLLRDNIGSPEALVIALSGSEACALHLAEVSPPPLGIGFIHPSALPKKLPRTVDLWALVAEEASSVVSREEVTVVAVAGADATFRKNLPEVGRLAVQWARRHTPRTG